MVQFFAYFEAMQIVLKLEHTKIFTRDYEINRFFITRQRFTVIALQMSL